MSYTGEREFPPCGPGAVVEEGPGKLQARKPNLLRVSRKRTQGNTSVCYVWTSAPWAFKTQNVDKIA